MQQGLGVRAQWLIGLALAALLAMTRGQHFASLDNLPSASWAVFFLAGVYLQPRWTLALFCLQALLLDLASQSEASLAETCLSPVYWMLLLAYACLWFAGRSLAARGWLDARQPLSSAVRLLASLAVVALLAYLISGGSFYFFSGRYPEADLVGFAERIAHYYPRQLLNLALYVGLAASLHIALAATLSRRISAHRLGTGDGH